jgi:hypothetical protein
MAKPVQLTIPSACHEDWHTMTAADKGRFCMSCHKNVVDFTNMSDREVLQHITRSSGSTCGRFYNDQLNRNMTIRKERQMPWLKYFFQMALPAFFISIKAEAQDCKKPVIEQTYRQKQLKNCTVEMLPAPEDKNAWKIQGKITDLENLPLLGASVTIKGSTKGTTTDNEGNFKFILPGNEKVTLVVSYIGFHTIEISATPSRETDGPIIKMNPVQVRLEQMVTLGLIIAKVPKSPKRSTLEIARSIITPDSVRIYPNPIGLGNNIEMELKVKEPGNFYVEVTDFSGRMMIKKEVQASAKVYQASIETTQLLAGRYIVCVRNRNGKKIGVKKIIIQ